MLEFPFNKVGGLKPIKFIKKKLQNRRFHVNISKFFRANFYRPHPVGGTSINVRSFFLSPPYATVFINEIVHKPIICFA